jgi:hypothetical protein
MIDRIGQTAIRSLGVDVANLSSRLALTQAIMEELCGIAASLDMPAWDHKPIPNDDGSQSNAYMTMIPGTEMEKVQAILSILWRASQED